MKTAPALEKAVFTGPRPSRRRLNRWAVFLGALALMAGLYAFARGIVYTRLVRSFAQDVLFDLVNGRVENIGSIDLDRQGDVVLRDAEVYAHHLGVRRLFYRAREIRVTLDGIPFRDAGIRVMRVDLHQPEIFLRREPGGDWNLYWALTTRRDADAPPPAPPAPDDPWRYYRRPDEDFPRNGVHIHDGTVHTTFISKSGKEATWTATGVRGSIAKSDGVLYVKPCAGEFYGGRIEAYAEIPRCSPLTIDQITVDVRGADVAKMAEGAPFITRPVSGRFDAVIAATVDRDRTRQRPIASGHCRITDGNLWELPAFAKVLNLLTLTSLSNRRIDSALLEFTFEEDYIRVDKMHFLGYPISLFGDGTCGLTGDWMEIVFFPRLGKGTWNSILPILGAPLDLLSNIFKGAFVPVVLTGSFEDPEYGVRPMYFLQGSEREKRLREEREKKIKRLVEEHPPK
jgi:hypothetical protein